MTSIVHSLCLSFNELLIIRHQYVVCIPDNELCSCTIVDVEEHSLEFVFHERNSLTMKCVSQCPCFVIPPTVKNMCYYVHVLGILR